MIYFIPWVILIVAAIVAVPVAAKMSPGSRRAVADDDHEQHAEGTEDGAVVGDDFVVTGDDFVDAESLGDDAFDDFK
ncbi:MAG: hypothetical protein KDB00_16320 [Planctomycetales bacterium]|nr:hypothetical protein [Planctomycetales bacterium]